MEGVVFQLGAVNLWWFIFCLVFLQMNQMSVWFFFSFYLVLCFSFDFILNDYYRNWVLFDGLFVGKIPESLRHVISFLQLLFCCLENATKEKPRLWYRLCWSLSFVISVFGSCRCIEDWLLPFSIVFYCFSCRVGRVLFGRLVLRAFLHPHPFYTNSRPLSSCALLVLVGGTVTSDVLW